MTNEKEYIPLAQSLMKVRTELLQKDVKKTGKNPMFKSPYFELKDFLPIVTPLFEKYGLATFFSIEIINGVEYAILEVVKENELKRFICPTANPSGSNPIFQMGQKITYFRRYLYQMCLDLCESDEAETNGDNAKNVDLATPGQVTTILSNGKLISAELETLQIKTENDVRGMDRKLASELVAKIEERKNANV